MAGKFNELENESSRKRLTVPKGFRNLLEGLTTEVLRSNPSDIYTFAADYFKSRLRERQVRGYDDCLLGSQIDGYYRYEPFRGSRKEIDAAATKIQSTFRGHKARKETKRRRTKEILHPDHAQGSAVSVLNSLGEKDHDAAACIQADYNTGKDLKARNEAATKIQAGYRGYTLRKGLKEKLLDSPHLQKIKEEGVAEIKQLNARKDSDELLDEREAAAVNTQSVFRGHRTSEAIRGGRPAGADGIGVNEMQQNEAATKIQSNYRGYYTRKQVKNKHEAAKKIDADYRGHRIRELRRTQSEAAVKIQSHYRGYKTRQQLKKRHSSKTFLKVANDEEFALHRDSRTSFSIPVGLKFEGPLDDDSDTEIEKMVNDLQAKQELQAIEESSDTADDKGDS